MPARGKPATVLPQFSRWTSVRALAVFLCLLAAPAFAGDITVAFSPDGGAEKAVVDVIGEAQHTIRLAAYGFTSKEIAAALVAAHNHGVDVEAVLDKSNQTARYSAATFLTNASIPTRIDSQYAIMHNKFLVIDGVTVETGSFNYTTAASERNAENVIILRDVPDVAAKYSARMAAALE